jgi:hypothetical protein
MMITIIIVRGELQAVPLFSTLVGLLVANLLQLEVMVLNSKTPPMLNKEIMEVKPYQNNHQVQYGNLGQCMKSDLLFKPIMEEATLTGFVLQIKR